MQNVDHSAGDFINLLQGLLRYDPASRLTAHEALKHPFLTEQSERRRWRSLVENTDSRYGSNLCLLFQKSLCAVHNVTKVPTA